MTLRSIVLALLAAAMFANGAPGATFSLAWRIVAEDTGLFSLPYQGMPENDATDGAAWSSLTRVTCDLYLRGMPGQRIHGIDMGDGAFSQASPFSMHTNGTVFNHSLGSHLRSGAMEIPPFNAMQYDTYLDLGGATISIPGSVDLNANGATDQDIRATWFTTDVATLDAAGEMRLMRITVGWSTNPWTSSGFFLGTPSLSPALDAGSPVSQLRVFLPAGEFVDLTIGNAMNFPTPGASALAAIAGLAGLRRRR